MIRYAAIAVAVLGAAALGYLLLRDAGVETLDLAVVRTPLDPWATVRGTVVDSGGKPVAGATVLAQNLRGFGGRAVTGSDGAWRLEIGPLRRLDPPWPGRPWDRAVVPARRTRIFLAAVAEGFAASGSVELDVERGAVRESPPIPLLRGGTIRGRILDAAGRSRSGRVRVTGRAAAGAPETRLEGIPIGYPREFVPCSAEGGFTIGPVAPGRVSLWASAGERGAAAGATEVREGEVSEVVLTLDVAILLAGRVVGPEGSGVPGVRVLCRRPRERPDPRKDTTGEREPRGAPTSAGPGGKPRPRRPERDRAVLGTETDGEGRFWFYGKPTEARFFVHLPDALGFPGSSRTDVPAGSEDVLLEMPPRYPVEGIVRDGGGSPVAGAALRILPERLAAMTSFEFPLGLRLTGDPLRAGPDGSFWLDPVCPGVYRVTCLAPGFEVAERRVSVDAADGPDESPLEFALERAAEVTGRVLDPEGRPVGGAELAVTAAPAGREGRRRTRFTGRIAARAAGDGTFSIPGLPSGVDLVFSVRGERGVTAFMPLSLGGGETLGVDPVVRLPARLVVHAVPRRGGDLPGHPVRLVRLDAGELDLMDRTGPDGRIRFDGLPLGRYRVLAVDPREDLTRPEVSERVTEVVLGAGEQRQLEIAVPDVTEVRVTVLRDGEPLGVAKVGFGPLPGTPDSFFPLLFDLRDGRLVERIPPGRYHLHVSIPGRRFEIEEEVAVPNRASFPIEIDLDGEEARVR